MKPDFDKYPDGLVPTIVVDDRTGQVLMMAYVNDVAYQRSLTSRETWFWSRSRQELWHKGATSGNTQAIKAMWIDCDEDTLLVQRAIRATPAVFIALFNYRKEMANMQDLDALYDLILDRKQTPKEGSYTNYLFTKGLDKILKKVGEESTEVIVAAKNDSDDEFVYEVADLAYHVLVLMANRGISVAQVKTELAEREGLMSKTKERRDIKKL